MLSKRLRLIYNPYAGRRKLTGQLDTVIRIFQESGHEVSVHRACSPEDIEETASRSWDVDRLVIAGGDGSIHQVVNGLVSIPTVQRPALGILPVGTANDLAYALRLPKSIPEACKIIGRGNVYSMDTGMVNNRYFVNVASAGLLTDVSQKVDIRVKNSLGQLAYFLKGIETLPSYRPFRVEFEYDGKRYTEEVILFMAVNGLSVGGIRQLVPRASLSDGKLDILMVPLVGWPETLRILLRVLRGEHVSTQRMKEFQISELTVHTDRPIHSDLDGELGPESTWRISVGPKISVFC
ncbi:diacylglycerol/lipid kinase family protein [Desulfosporosinus sp. SB140]|uniref:diacylglycerol/lipid kinase family protein n=1 Tax=Desulfosporosinus paludis TaxID=3115649 RepID=UPI003890BDA8